MSVGAPPAPPPGRPAEPPPAAPMDATDEVPVVEASPAAVEQHATAGPSTSEVLTVCGAAFLSAGAAGWMAAGVFDGSFARVVALLGALLGAGMVALSYRLRRPSVIQYLIAPVAVVAGALLVIPDAQGGSANLPSLVAEALFSGGIGAPPVPFEPGWRFVLAAVTVLLGGAAASLALGFRRSNLAVFLPVPVVFATALVQPPGAEIISTVVSFVLVVAALAVAFGVELARSGASSGSFELRRLARGLAVLAVLAVGLVGLANVATFLLPEPRSAEVIPPQRPEPSPPLPDAELFTVAANRLLPWRLGVLDVYEENAWKLPPYDVNRFVPLPPTGAVPDAPEVEGDPFTATFEITDLPGRALPAVAGAVAVEVAESTIDFDPRTQALRLPRLTPPGFRYTVTAAPVPTGEQLAAADDPPAALNEFLDVPEAPAEVTALLAGAQAGNAYARLQILRSKLFEEVVAAGAGQPVDVPPARVAQMLTGAEATPYEITAAEALLARWAGVPSRIGYGYFGGEKPAKDAAYSVRPEQGSTWLEVYFDGHGWVPLVGKPAKARSSLSDAVKREDASVRPTDELALVTYVPVRLETITLLFELVRFYALQAIPAILALVLALIFYPAALRALRRARRARWARRAGPVGRIAVAYAGMRDTAWDFNIGHPTQTPLEFTGQLAPDAEHTELAWLVSRALWGDLRRDLRPEDAQDAEVMAASVGRRLRGAQPFGARMLAAASRASLRDPYSRELPNAWLSWSPRRALGGALRRVWRLVSRPLRRLASMPHQTLRRLRPRPAAATIAIVALLLSGCAEPIDLASKSKVSHLPAPAVPKRLAGLVFKREPSAEKAFKAAGADALIDRGQVYSVNRKDVVEASLQVAQLKPGLFDREDDVRDGITQSLGGGEFEPVRVRGERAAVLEAPEQRLFLWFSPDGTYYELFVARREFSEAADLFGALLAFQRGEKVTSLKQSGVAGASDPRRGIP